MCLIGRGNALGMSDAVDHELLRRVRRDGWRLLPLPRTTESFSEDLLRFSRRLGDPVPGRRRATVEVLRPLAPEAARPRSLSALHGSNTFPLHTDGAYRLLPPRFIVLACQCPGTRSVPTVLVHFADIRITNRKRVAVKARPFSSQMVGIHSIQPSCGQPRVLYDLIWDA